MRNREAWLHRATSMLRDRFEKAGHVPPATHVSTGFPSKSALSSKRRIGECWSNEVSSDKRAHIFISPVLSDTVKVVATLAHELVHATVGHKAKHGPLFKQCAVAIGLTGKMTSTVAGPEFAQWVTDKLVPKIGAYPHPDFNPQLMSRPKESTRLLKCECPQCGYIARVTGKWVDAVGAPICPCDGETVMICERKKT